MVPAELPELETEIGRVAYELNEVVEDLREIARGIHPAILSEGGSGLIGLRDRAEAMGGSLEVSSPPGQGTLIGVQLPLRLH
jgi:signal transduction histidine kinase